ncbi:MAG: GAF domain-containing protein [Pseudomonadota bacterium]|nr:GAF domain-containing protein [Pseudomonadota bacterium]
MTPAARELRRQVAVDSLLPDDFEGIAYDDNTRQAAAICQAPVALITVIDGALQLFKSRVGTDLTSRPRELTFCAHALLGPEEVTIVEDATLDERFAANPAVVGDPKLRFYAGVPLFYGGQPVGTLCVFDVKPRTLEPQQVENLRFLAATVMTTLEQKRRSLADGTGSA